jgi:hypothetical protein
MLFNSYEFILLFLPATVAIFLLICLTWGPDFPSEKCGYDQKHQCAELENLS